MSPKQRRSPHILSHHNDLIDINILFHCDHYAQSRAFLRCALCERYRKCQQISDEDKNVLLQSPLMDKIFDKFIPRRNHMFVLEYLDGSFKVVEELDLANPDLQLIEGIKEVHEIKKTYVPQVILRPKPKDERKEIEAQAKTAEKKPAKK